MLEDKLKLMTCCIKEASKTWNDAGFSIYAEGHAAIALLAIFFYKETEKEDERKDIHIG